MNKCLYKSGLALAVLGTLFGCNSSSSENGGTVLQEAAYACQANVLEQSNQLRTYQIMVESGFVA